ncbi:hypothetical protein F511_15890 [Dorcoceras hygrometricum]|uniref:Dystroglycan-like n=1 Tax=Dorcoceras hygrometricum TaxID=472368 RepID=A0A2Z7CDY3_9LAMI|nr:hypothetical protein F511_15890 [Dorcoceras hygrometricum]
MAASLIQNDLHVNFDSVLSLSDEGMVAMFKSLESIGLPGFLGCPYVIYEQTWSIFFAYAFVRANALISSVQGKFLEISEERFAGMFELLSEGLMSVDEVPKELINASRKDFSASGELIKTSFKKKEMKVVFRMLNDILAKTDTAKAGSFDAVTHERFLLMAAIHGGVKINWSKLLFDILKTMVTKSSKQVKGFAAQICVLLKSTPELTLGESKTFPPLKILTVKTVGTYIAKNKFVSTTPDEVTVEPMVEKVVKAAEKRIPAPVVTDPAAMKKRTTVGRAAPTAKTLALVPVVTEAEPIFVIPTKSPRSPRRQVPKRKLILQESDEHSRCRYSDLQDVCMAIESLTTLDLPMVVDSIRIYELKGPYYTLTMIDWFLQALSVIPRGSWGVVARRFTMVRWIDQKNVFSDLQ